MMAFLFLFSESKVQILVAVSCELSNCFAATAIKIKTGISRALWFCDGDSFLPPANEVCEGYVFTPVYQSFCSWGGVCLGMVRGGACVVMGGMCGCRGACVGCDEIRSMSGRYASYWNAFLLDLVFVTLWRRNAVSFCTVKTKPELSCKKLNIPEQFHAVKRWTYENTQTCVSTNFMHTMSQHYQDVFETLSRGRIPLPETNHNSEFKVLLGPTRS